MVRQVCSSVLQGCTVPQPEVLNRKANDGNVRCYSPHNQHACLLKLRQALPILVGSPELNTSTYVCQAVYQILATTMRGRFNGRCSGNANFGFNNLTIKHVVVAEGQLMQTKTSLLMIELPVAGVLIGVVAGVTPGQTPQPDDHGRKAVYDPTLHC